MIAPVAVKMDTWEFSDGTNSALQVDNLTDGLVLATCTYNRPARVISLGHIAAGGSLRQSTEEMVDEALDNAGGSDHLSVIYYGLPLPDDNERDLDVAGERTFVTMLLARRGIAHISGFWAVSNDEPLTATLFYRRRTLLVPRLASIRFQPAE